MTAQIITRTFHNGDKAYMSTALGTDWTLDGTNAYRVPEAVAPKLLEYVKNCNAGDCLIYRVEPALSEQVSP